MSHDFGWNTPTVSNLSGALLWEHHCRQSAGVRSVCVVSFIESDRRCVCDTEKQQSGDAHTTCHLYAITTVKTMRLHTLRKKPCWERCVSKEEEVESCGSTRRSGVGTRKQRDSGKTSSKGEQMMMSEQVTGSVWLDRCRAQRAREQGKTVRVEEVRGSHSLKCLFSHLDMSFFGRWSVP